MNLPAEKTDHAESYSQEGDPNVQGARILLIEDDEALRELMERNLLVRHHTVSIAADAASALRYLRTSTFDLIILDINLPDLSGWDVLRIASREGHLQFPQIDLQQEEKLPIVVVSAVRVSPRRLSEFRPRAYLPKPFPMEALLRLAVEAAERKGGADQSVPDQEDIATNDITSSPSREEDFYD
jgi:DNA-binding response OmpR family regulator